MARQDIFFNCDSDERDLAIEIMKAGIEYIKNFDKVGTFEEDEAFEDPRINTNNFDVISLILRSVYSCGN